MFVAAMNRSAAVLRTMDLGLGYVHIGHPTLYFSNSRCQFVPTFDPEIPPTATSLKRVQGMCHVRSADGRQDKFEQR